MKKIFKLTIVLSVLFCSISNAQMNYNVTFPKGMTFTPITGGTVPPLTIAYSPSLAIIENVAKTDEGAANNIALPFPFIFNCVSYSSCNISTNGFISFGRQIDTLTAYYANNLKSGPIVDTNVYHLSRLTRPLIAPLWADIDVQNSTNLAYSTSGIAPNRVFTVQWLNALWNFTASSASISFQVQLYESDNSIVFIYKKLSGTTLNARASVGLADCSLGSGNFISLSKLKDSAIISSTQSFDNISLVPPTNFAVKFTPNTCTQIKTKAECKGLPFFNGKVFYDVNNNGIKDSLENYASLAKVGLANGRTVNTGFYGDYSLFADSIGTYSLSVTSPNYYNALPPIANFNVTNSDTVIYQDFALQANKQIDSTQLLVQPMLWRARPGFSYPYFFAYRNIGTTRISVSLNFNYNSSKLILDSVSNPEVINNGSALKLQIDSLTPGGYGFFIGYFRVNPTVPIGDSIVTYTSLTYTDSVKLVNVVGGSYDPNDKNCTPVLTPAQVNSGKYIDYTIRFQNTGTDTAFTVVVIDTLSSKLQPKTIIVEGASQNFKTTIDSNIVKFEFFNILLPDSNVNEAKSHGFVKFKIKPVAGLANGDMITNKASIYFDYNSPVVTNSCVTQINITGVVTPLKLISYNATKKNKELSFEQYKFINDWTTINEVNVAHFNVQRSTNSLDFVNVGKVTAHNKNYNYYSFIDEQPINNLINVSAIYYRLEIVDIDGKINYSDIKVLYLNTLKDDIYVYPNPSKNSIFIQAKDAVKVYIIDAVGNKMFEKTKFNDIINCDISSFKNGLYFIQVINKKGEKSMKKLLKN